MPSENIAKERKMNSNFIKYMYTNTCVPCSFVLFWISFPFTPHPPCPSPSTAPHSSHFISTLFFFLLAVQSERRKKSNERALCRWVVVVVDVPLSSNQSGSKKKSSGRRMWNEHTTQQRSPLWASTRLWKFFVQALLLYMSGRLCMGRRWRGKESALPIGQKYTETLHGVLCVFAIYMLSDWTKKKTSNESGKKIYIFLSHSARFARCCVCSRES